MKVEVETRFSTNDRLTLATMAAHPEDGDPILLVVGYIRVTIASVGDAAVYYWCRAISPEARWTRGQQRFLGGDRLQTGEYLFAEKELVAFPERPAEGTKEGEARDA